MQFHESLFHATLNHEWFLHAIKWSSKTRFLKVAEHSTASAKGFTSCLTPSTWVSSAQWKTKKGFLIKLQVLCSNHVLTPGGRLSTWNHSLRWMDSRPLTPMLEGLACQGRRGTRSVFVLLLGRDLGKGCAEERFAGFQLLATLQK